MLISVWSSHHGQCASTTNLIALSLSIALSEKAKVLLSHSQYGETQLERALVPDIDNYMQDTLCNYGLEPVLRLCKNALLNTENFSDYTIPLLKNNGYDLLAGIRKNIDGRQEKIVYENAVIKALEIANKKYDYVFVDIASGFINDLSKRIMEISDLVIISINQNKYVLEKLRQAEFTSEIAEKSIYCIGRYDASIKSNAKNIARKYKIKELITVPYSAQLIDIINRGEILEVFGRNILEKRTVNSKFFSELLKSSESLLKKLDKIKSNR